MKARAPHSSIAGLTVLGPLSVASEDALALATISEFRECPHQEGWLANECGRVLITMVARGR
jgi:hypothetical protein